MGEQTFARGLGGGEPGIPILGGGSPSETPVASCTLGMRAGQRREKTLNTLGINLIRQRRQCPPPSIFLLRAVLLMIVGGDVKCQHLVCAWHAIWHKCFCSLHRHYHHHHYGLLFFCFFFCEGASVRIARRTGKLIYCTHFWCRAADVLNLPSDYSWVLCYNGLTVDSLSSHLPRMSLCTGGVGWVFDN